MYIQWAKVLYTTNSRNDPRSNIIIIILLLLFIIIINIIIFFALGSKDPEG